jgi:hypothetical protein
MICISIPNNSIYDKLIIIEDYFINFLEIINLINGFISFFNRDLQDVIKLNPETTQKYFN